MASPSRCIVKHMRVKGKAVAGTLAALDGVCNAGASCQEVQASPTCGPALAALQATVATAHASLIKRTALVTELLAAVKGLQIDVAAALAALHTYESAVNGAADGDGALIARAGLLARTTKRPTLALGVVTDVTWKPGKEPGEAVLSWPPTPGATSYAVEVSFTPQDPAAPFTSLGTGTNRSRVVKAPTPGAQILARVAAVDGDATRSAWSDPILVTVR